MVFPQRVFKLIAANEIFAHYLYGEYVRNKLKIGETFVNWSK